MKQIGDPAGLAQLMGINFSDQQIAAITADLAPGVIIAGAGTGKTTVMAARIVWLVSQGLVSPSGVLGLTFTRKAALELATRIRGALGLLELEATPDVSTYDGFAANLLREFGPWLGLREGTIISEAERWVLADQVVCAHPVPPGRLRERALTTLVDDLLELENQIQCHLVSEAAIRDYSQQFDDWLDQAPGHARGAYKSLVKAKEVLAARLDLLGLCAQYREIKRAQAVMEFGDQMAAVVGLAHGLPLMGASLRRRYQLVVVDEYQDTSPAQARLLSTLFGSGGGIADYPITAVGDPLQAIYTWRGAACNNIYDFPQAFPGRQLGNYDLSINRRSGGKIIAAANAVASAIREDPLLASSDIQALRVPDSVGEGEVVVREFQHADEEAAWVAAQLASDYDPARGWGEMAVLLRRNGDIGPIAQACREAGIPVEIQDPGGLLSLEPVRQVHLMLRLLVDETANPQVVEILAGPRFRLRPADLDWLGRRARALARVADEPLRLIAAVLDPGVTGPARVLAACERLAADYRALLGGRGSLVDQVRAVIAQIGLEVEIHVGPVEDYPQLSQFLATIAEFSRRTSQPNLGSLVAWLDAELEHASGLTKVPLVARDAVQILTVHRAKGMEWDTVYLPRVVGGVFPDERLKDNPVTALAALPTELRSDAAALPQIGAVTNAGLEAYAEALRAAVALGEDRLAYVGLTRARRRLVVSGHRQAAGITRGRKRSRYLQVLAALELGEVELLADDVEDGEAGLGWVVWPGADAGRWAESAAAVRRAQAGQVTWVSEVPGEVAAEIATWDGLIAELSAPVESVVEVPLPAVISTTQLLALSDDPDGFAARLARPLPSAPSSGARVGSRFHAWVEQFFRTSQLAGIGDLDSDPQLAELQRAFLASPYASARPCAVEQDFVTTLDGLPISGRIDAVFRAGDNPGLLPVGKAALIIDWKTGGERSDSRQLEVYARAWAEQAGVALESLMMGFYFVSTGRFVDTKLNP